MKTLVIVLTVTFVSLYNFVSATAGQTYISMVTKGECEFYCTVENQPIRTYPNQDVTNHSDYGFTYSNVHVDEHNLYVTVTNNGERNQWGWGVIIALYDDNGLWNCLGYASYNGLESQETLNAGQSFDVVLPLYNNNEYHPITTYTVQFGD